MQPNPPANVYNSTNRTRSNTINTQLDNIPPALARLQHMNQDVIKGRNALTPVMNRGDDAVREWERRQSGKTQTAAYPTQLEYLHQQAELANQHGLGAWGNSGYRHQPPSSKLAQSYHPAPPQGAILIDDDRRDAAISAARSAARGDPPGSAGGLYTGGTSANITSPPQAYSGGVAGSGAGRYPTTYPAQAPPQQSPMDVGSMYAPIQPDQYGGYGPGTRHAQPAQPMPPSFYGTGVIPTQGAQGGPITPGVQPGQQMSPPGGQVLGGKDSRRSSGMDVWPPR